MIGTTLYMLEEDYSSMPKYIPYKIFGQTRDYWLAGPESYPTKIKKKDFSIQQHKNYPPRPCFTLEQVQDREWLRKNLLAICNKIQYSKDVNLIKVIADMLKHESIPSEYKIKGE